MDGILINFQLWSIHHGLIAKYCQDKPNRQDLYEPEVRMARYLEYARNFVTSSMEYNRSEDIPIRHDLPILSKRDYSTGRNRF